MKHILVTGGNSGIGLALCKLLSTEHKCHVYMGSRSKERGAAAVKTIVDACPEAASNIELVQIDVQDDSSCAAAAAALKAKGVSLYALVNNAGIGLAHGDMGGHNVILNTNYLGPKRVTDACVGLIAKGGRVVNVSSGVASMWMREQPASIKELFCNPQITQEELDAAVTQAADAGNLGMGKGYGLSKAALTTLTLVQARTHPHLKIVSLSPGFINTNMTKGFGAKLSPEQGCVSSLKCLFGDVTSGYYYGSDGLRSPFTCTRDPGMPEYDGEANADPKKYNK